MSEQRASQRSSDFSIARILSTNILSNQKKQLKINPDKFKQDFNKDNFNPDFNQGKFDQDKFNQDKFNQEKFNQDKFNQEKFNQDKFNQEKFNQDKFNQEKFNQDKFSKEKFDQDKFNQDKFDQDTFNQDKFDQDTFNQDKFDQDSNLSSDKIEFKNCKTGIWKITDSEDEEKKELKKAERLQTGNSNLEFEDNEQLIERQLPWLQCTRYSPPKLPRRQTSKQRKRRLGSHPRIPFTKFQIQVLEEKYKINAYLSRRDVIQLGGILNLPQNRVKIWFQNRRARERKESQTDNIKIN